jgi:cytochrome c553
MLTGSFKPGAQIARVAAAARPADAGSYFVHALCAECHDVHQDRPGGEHPAPALAPIAAAYTDADFRTLLKTGVGAGGREVGFMATIVRENLHALSDTEIDQIHAYLRAEAAPLSELERSKIYPHWARWRSFWSASTNATIASTTGAPRMPTHGS